MMEWQPIETAPKDGTEFLACASGEMAVVWWCKFGEMWVYYDDMNGGEFAAITHWMPLPDAPDAK